MTNFKEAALAYWDFGYNIMPLRPGTKIPFNQKWTPLQTKRFTREQIMDLWTRYPDANIAIITGRLSGIAVVDFDSKDISLSLPPTRIVSTPHGWHFYYAYIEGITNRGAIYPGVDIRGEGGYIVAPPSRVICQKPDHEGLKWKEENEYIWQTDIDPQPFPVEIFKCGIVKPKADLGLLLQGVPEGNKDGTPGRNETGAAIAGKILSVTPRAAWLTTGWELFLAWNTLNKPPLAERELRAIFNSIASRELRKEGEDDQIVQLSQLVKTLAPEGIAYSTGYKEIDDVVRGGLRPGDLVILSGRTGEGKTFFSQSLTYNLVKNKIPCAWFSFEVLYEELWRKFQEMGLQDEALVYVPKRNSGATVDWLKKKILEARDTYNTRIIFIDHLGFISGLTNYDKNLSNNYAMFLTLITRALKQVAVQENLVMILIAHQSRTNDPTLDSIAYSAGIAQEADHVWVIQRKEEDSVLKIEKNRPTGMRIKMRLSLDDARLIAYTEAFSKGLGVKQKAEVQEKSDYATIFDL